jgi:hypothetical protein
MRICVQTEIPPIHSQFFPQYSLRFFLWFDRACDGKIWKALHGAKMTAEYLRRKKMPYLTRPLSK